MDDKHETSVWTHGEHRTYKKIVQPIQIKHTYNKYTVRSSSETARANIRLDQVFPPMNAPILCFHLGSVLASYQGDILDNFIVPYVNVVIDVPLLLRRATTLHYPATLPRIFIPSRIASGRRSSLREEEDDVDDDDALCRLRT